MTFPANPLMGQTVIAPAGGAFTWSGREWANSYFSVPSATFSGMARSAAVARTNNPRVNPIMTTPPTITTSATHDATLTVQYGWNGNIFGLGIGPIYDPPTGNGPFNYSGGVPQSMGFGAVQMLAATYDLGSFKTGIVSRMETYVDAVKVEFQMFSSQTAARFRVIVDGQYVSLAETALAVTGNFSFIVLDFTAAGGRKLRHVIIESYQAGYGSATSVGPTATLQKPGAPARKMAVMADSFGVGTASTIMNCFPGYLGDLLGVPNVENNGVPATGYLANNAGANLTTRQRIVPDIVPFAPDILLITTGFNDRGMDLTALQAEVTTTMRTIRAQSALLYVPVIVCMFAGNHMTGAQPAGAAEQAIQAGVAAAADPLIYFIPTINGPNGPWLTGSGYQGATTGDGNCDIYISTDGTHPNDSGHAYLAGRLADEIARLLG